MTVLKRTNTLASIAIIAIFSGRGPQIAQAIEVDPTDKGMTRHVNSEMLFDLAVDSSEIEIETINGVVTLSGEVNNLLAKQRAARIAQAVKGVRSVINEILVRPDRVHADIEILGNINSALKQNPATESYEILAQVEDGRATLNGTVDSWQEKQLAAKVASGVAGLRELTNNLKVDVPETRLDSEIENEIQEIFKWDLFIPTPNGVEVSSQDGQVKLTGEIHSAAAKYRAFNKAWVAGVKSVSDDELTVKPGTGDARLKQNPTPVLTDDEIRNAIEHAMIYDPRVFSFNIEADVDFGVATLTGTVHNQQAARAAAQNARNTVGVKTVVNRLKVEQGNMTDAAIEKRVKDAIGRHPYLEDRQIVVDVDNGVVKLYGSVDTLYEKTEAENEASQIRGTVLVDNNLLVFDNEIPYAYDPYIDEFSLDRYSWYEPETSVTTKLDSDIKEDIEAELYWSPFVDEDEVEISIDDGVATLTGNVDSWSERDAAEENALEGGAIKVVNKLDIE